MILVIGGKNIIPYTVGYGIAIRPSVTPHGTDDVCTDLAYPKKGYNFFFFFWATYDLITSLKPFGAAVGKAYRPIIYRIVCLPLFGLAPSPCWPVRCITLLGIIC